MPALAKTSTVGVVGAGTMGAGISQVAAAAGHKVRLHDSFEGAAAAGKQRLAEGLGALVSRGKLKSDEVAALLDRIEIATDLDAFTDVSLAIEVINEDLEAKRRLVARLDAVLPVHAVIATNTSSISITSIAKGSKHPARVVGMHFFNPAPIMKLVEIVSGVSTSRDIAETLFATAQAWGKIAVHAKSTPGFIVNRVARPYYAEALRLYEEQVADPATIDALLTQGGGFRMGPFELMDLIGNDVNYAVTCSVFNAYYQDPRFRPSIAQLELVNAGHFGRKAGRGFYDYSDVGEKTSPATISAPDGTTPLANFKLESDSTHEGVRLVVSDGRTAKSIAKAVGQPVIVCDLGAPVAGSRLGFATSPDVSSSFINRFAKTLDAQGISATCLPDWPGLVVLRTVAMLANEAFEAILQGVADEAAIDAAMRFGVNYPKGPIEWARQIGLQRVLAVIDNLYLETKDPRYRASLRLRRAAEG